MTDALSSSVSVVAYLTLFAGVAVVFLLANLLIGRLVRPANPHPEKLEIYECGEPTIGSSFVQFDLRFYVVALLFIIFDVEVAFFFPWATVFGKSTHLMREDLTVAERVEGRLALTPDAQAMYRELE
jgi:NADH-quinone oxidoreductase subunit A